MSINTEGRFWGVIGKLGVILTVTWIIIQMISYFTKTSDYKINVTGKHYPYVIAATHWEHISNYKKITALDKSYVENVNSKGTSIKNLLKFGTSKEASDNWRFTSSFSKYFDYQPIIDVKDYNEIWTFQIENTGVKPIEDLIIETPFKGYYKLNSQKGNTSQGIFENRIALENLATGYSVNVMVWIENHNYYNSELVEEKTRITHKFGWEQIEYPVIVDGILAWNSRLESTPLFILVVILIFLIFGSFVLGVENGPKLIQREKDRKLKEFEKLKKESEASENE